MGKLRLGGLSSLVMVPGEQGLQVGVTQGHLVPAHVLSLQVPGTGDVTLLHVTSGAEFCQAAVTSQVALCSCLPSQDLVPA